jgi:hypothetical protein
MATTSCGLRERDLQVQTICPRCRHASDHDYPLDAGFNGVEGPRRQSSAERAKLITSVFTPLGERRMHELRVDDATRAGPGAHERDKDVQEFTRVGAGDRGAEESLAVIPCGAER